MCDACENLSKVWDASQELMVARFTNHQNGFPTFLLVQGNKNPQTVKIAVNYCPWCGEKLEHKTVKGGGEDGDTA